MNLHEKDLRSKIPPNNQFVVTFETDGKKVRLHFTTQLEKEAKDWAEGLQYLKTYSERKTKLFHVMRHYVLNTVYHNTLSHAH